MKFDIITIFPKILDSYFAESILKRAIEARLIEVEIHNLRDFSEDKPRRKVGIPTSLLNSNRASGHHKVDDRPFGGGPGMVLQIPPLYRAVEFVKSKVKSQKSKVRNRTILLSAKGKKFDEKVAKRLAKYDQLIFICGRYEGVDERVADYVADEELSIGEYILSGGELPAAVIIEAVARFVPGVLGNEESVSARPYPVYSRPEVFIIRKTLRQAQGKKKLKVPKILLSGDHKKIEKWRKLKSL